MRAPTATDKLSSDASIGFRAKFWQLTQIGRYNTPYKLLHTQRKYVILNCDRLLSQLS
jgi:hypothetical protein